MFDISPHNSKTNTWHPIENSEGAGGMVFRVPLINCQDGLSSLESIRFDGSREGPSFPPGLGIYCRFCFAWLFEMTCGRCSFPAMSFWNRIQTKEIERVMLIGSSIQMNRIDGVDEIVFSYVLLTYVHYIYICHICPMSSLCISICFFAYRAYHQNFPFFRTPRSFTHQQIFGRRIFWILRNQRVALLGDIPAS